MQFDRLCISTVFQLILVRNKEFDPALIQRLLIYTDAIPIICYQVLTTEKVYHSTVHRPQFSKRFDGWYIAAESIVPVNKSSLP